MKTFGDKELVLVDGVVGTVIDSPAQDCYVVELQSGEKVDRTGNTLKSYYPNIADCTAQWDNEFLIIRFGKEVVYREHNQYCHIKTAWLILSEGRPAKWKTVSVLTTLRQALRERFVQGMPLEAPQPGCSRGALNEFLRQARAFDKVHHGSVTF